MSRNEKKKNKKSVVEPKEEEEDKEDEENARQRDRFRRRSVAAPAEIQDHSSSTRACVLCDQKKNSLAIINIFFSDEQTKTKTKIPKKKTHTI